MLHHVSITWVPWMCIYGQVSCSNDKFHTSGTFLGGSYTRKVLTVTYDWLFVAIYSLLCLGRSIITDAITLSIASHNVSLPRAGTAFCRSPRTWGLRELVQSGHFTITSLQWLWSIIPCEHKHLYQFPVSVTLRWERKRDTSQDHAIFSIQFLIVSQSCHFLLRSPLI